MNIKDCTTIDQLEAFLQGSQAIAYTVLNNKDERYQWIQEVLIRFRYLSLKKRDKGTVIRFLMKVSGYSRQQMTRLIKRYRKTGKIRRHQQTVRGFAQRYTDTDIRLLAAMDEDHNQPCGATIKKLCERAWQHYHESDFERLASISASHIYNLRKTSTYKNVRRVFTHTQSKASPIGERRKPHSDGKPGYLRVDSVHQGDQDKVKGVYHINLVDIETQITISCTVEKISEAYMIPALESMFDILPFKIRGFHSDNGSEYINKTVAKLLNKLRIEFTKSRARKSTDNALAESKNASVIRKNFGYSHIPQHWANEMNRLVQKPLYIYQNFHRPCFFPTTKINAKGKEEKVYKYKNMMTPCEKLLSVPNVEDYLKPGVTAESLRAIAQEQTDNQAAKTLQQAKQQLFKKVFAIA